MTAHQSERLIRAPLDRVRELLLRPLELPDRVVAKAPHRGPARVHDSGRSCQQPEVVAGAGVERTLSRLATGVEVEVQPVEDGEVGVDLCRQRHGTGGGGQLASFL